MALILVPSPSLNGSPSPRPLQIGRKPSKSHYKVAVEIEEIRGGVVVGGGRSSKCGEMSKNSVIGLPSESRFRSFLGSSALTWSPATTVPAPKSRWSKNITYRFHFCRRLWASTSWHPTNHTKPCEIVPFLTLNCVHPRSSICHFSSILAEFGIESSPRPFDTPHDTLK